jgi:UDP-N-acetylmuramate dehydrogenase
MIQDDAVTQQLQAIFGERLKLKEPLARHLNMKLGGPAEWFCEVKTVDELKAGMAVVKRHEHYDWFVLGGGSNTLANDTGFDGIVFKLAMRELTITGNRVSADAGVISAMMARKTAEAGLKGFTWAISLPGTIGGAVRGNAGCFGGETRDQLVEVEVLRGGEIITIPASELHFGYRESAIKHSDDIILRAHFEFESGDPVTLKQELIDIVDNRKKTQPLYAGSAGCIFKNVEASPEDLARVGEKYPLPPAMRDLRRIGAGWIIDQLDLKGTTVGGAQISKEHGNFMINDGSATASDIAQLIAIVKTKVRNELGIQLQEEVEYLGF